MRKSKDRFVCDVVIPSFRCPRENIEAILDLEKPPGADVNYYLVIDDPELGLPDEIDIWVSDHDLTVLRNDANLGAHLTRNSGFEVGEGEWVLFLDDDVIPVPELLHEYWVAIRQDDVKRPGYVGVTRFPDAKNSFTRGVIASQILTFFDLALERDEMWWGVTANLLVRRDAVGDIRFRQVFPRAGGGEDIDYCLNIAKRAGRLFATVSDAVVFHDWWNGGRRGWKRFARWAFGDARLPLMHPEFAYRNWPNVAETALLVLLLSAGLAVAGRLAWSTVFFVLVALLLAEFVAEWGKLISSRRFYSPLAALESATIRAANDLGRLWSNLSRGRVHGITERFDYFCTGESVSYERRVAMAKFAVYLAVILAAFLTFWKG